MFQKIDENDYNTLIETFVSQQYAWLASKLEPHTVAIDIGAHCGDSAIYMAQKENVDLVLAFDNDPGPAKRAEAIMMQAQPTVRQKIMYELAEVVGQENGKFEVWIPQITIRKILSRQRNPTVIKCDCEGAEHEIFTDAALGAADLERVYAVQIEYHRGPQGLPRFFSGMGFCVEVMPPWYHDESLGDVGWLHAWR
jgi:hypothetical protein